MSLIDKPLDSVNEDDLQELIGNERETKAMEFKVSLPGNSDGDKKEFLYDVSSFANASGGHIIYGIKEENGIAAELLGLQVDNPDAVILRLEEIIRTGIELRIPGIQIKPISLQRKNIAIIIRIPQSWALPHRVKFGGSSKFYSRNSAGKYELDVSELRTLFVLSETRAEKLRNFRLERLSRIVSGETPVLLQEWAKIVLHILPIAVSSSSSIDLSKVEKINDDNRGLLKPLATGGHNILRYNFEGILTNTSRDDKSSNAYLQVFRNGSIEAVNSSLMKWHDKKVLRHVEFEKSVIEQVERAIQLQRHLQVEPPLFLMLTLIGVKGYRMTFQSFWDDLHEIDRDVLVIPEIMIESFEVSPQFILRPVFDSIWNSAGQSGSINYDAEGKWNPR